MLIPDNISEFDSIGEKLLYLRFKNESSFSYMYVLHSVFTNHHLKSVSGELDFLVLAPGQGIFALEVKHGRVARRDGVWEFTDGKGNTTKKTKGPFAQVTGTMHSIRNYILTRAKKDFKQERLSKLIWGTGVAFTSMNEPPDFGQEADSWQMLTKEGLTKSGMGNYVKALSDGFHKKFENQHWYDSDLARPSKADCEYIIQIIRGDFDTSYNYINKIREGENVIEEFTKEQFHLLDISEYNDRCLFEGGAGTGKTILALELLKRKTESKLKTGLFCYNKNLGDYLSSSIEKIDIIPGYTGSLHGFLLQKTDIQSADYIHQFFSEELPFQFLIQNENLPESDKFDFIIIDEAQDLISSYYLEVLDLILKGGIKNGKWIFFGDFNKQAIYLDQPKEKMIRLLKEKSDFTTIPPLQINCRNTKKIARQNTLLTGADYPKFLHGGLEGDPIVQRFPAGNSYLNTIENALDDLLRKGVTLSEIVLLSPKSFEKSSIAASNLINDLISEGLSYSTIQAYKGLEKNIVIVFDFNELQTIQSQQLLYVALSRAKQMLYIIIDKKLENHYNQLIQKNSGKINLEC